MKTLVELSWHIVCGRYEVEELKKENIISDYEPNNPRHTLFLKMKYPTQFFLQGGWGPEVLYYDKEDDWHTGQLGKVWATDSRANEISTWIRDKMFNV